MRFGSWQLDGHTLSATPKALFASFFKIEGRTLGFFEDFYKFLGLLSVARSLAVSAGRRSAPELKTRSGRWASSSMRSPWSGGPRRGDRGVWAGGVVCPKAPLSIVRKYVLFLIT